MVADEEAQLRARRRLVEASRPEIDQEGIQNEKHDIDLIERQLDGLKPRLRHSSGNMMWGDDAAFPWRVFPMPSADRHAVRLLFLYLVLIIGAFVLLLVLANFLL